MINIKKAFLILLVFTVLFVAFMTGFGFLAVTFIIPYVIFCYNGAISLFTSKLLTSFIIGIVGAISIVPIYNTFKGVGKWVKRKTKKVKAFFKKRFGKKTDEETQTERLEYPEQHPYEDVVSEVVEK